MLGTLRSTVASTAIATTMLSLTDTFVAGHSTFSAAPGPLHRASSTIDGLLLGRSDTALTSASHTLHGDEQSHTTSLTSAMTRLHRLLLLVVVLACITLSHVHSLTVHLVPHTHDDVGWLNTVSHSTTCRSAPTHSVLTHPPIH